MSMAFTIIAKSDQLNSDDLIGKKVTITVTRVEINPTADQPVTIHFEGDAGKPYRPGKSMRRVMVSVWGPDAADYAGRSMTLYRDENVTFGGMKVGGIRISHMTDIDEAQKIGVNSAKGKKKVFEVLPLDMKQPPPQRSKADDRADAIVALFEGCDTAQAVMLAVDKARASLDALRQLPDQGPYDRADAARAAAYQRHVKPPEEGA